MIYGFCLNRFRYGLLSVASRCSAVVDDEHKTLNISNQDEANAFPAQAMPLEAVSSISSGHGPCSMMLKIDFLASKSASGRAPLLFIEFHRASDRASFYEVLEKESGERKLQIDETADRAFRRWEDNIPEPSVEELHEQLAAKQSEIESLQKQLADAHIGQQNATTDPEGGYQLDDMLPFQISQVLRVLNGYDRKEEQLKDVLEELADAQDQIARQQSQVAALAVALINTDALPAFMTEKDLHKYLASSSIGLLPDDVIALNDNPQYKQAMGRVFRQAET